MLNHQDSKLISETRFYKPSIITAWSIIFNIISNYSHSKFDVWRLEFVIDSYTSPEITKGKNIEDVMALGIVLIVI